MQATKPIDCDVFLQHLVERELPVFEFLLQFLYFLFLELLVHAATLNLLDITGVIYYYKIIIDINNFKPCIEHYPFTNEHRIVIFINYATNCNKIIEAIGVHRVLERNSQEV